MQKGKTANGNNNGENPVLLSSYPLLGPKGIFVSCRANIKALIFENQLSNGKPPKQHKKTVKQTFGLGYTKLRVN